MPPLLRTAPPLQASRWFNVPQPIQLEQLIGRVVMIHAFQMRCAGCVEFATPQAQRVHDFFGSRGVVVLGLHAVFENHETQTPGALEQHIRERGLSFPIAVDAPDGAGGVPLTMRALALDGTPSVVLLDRVGAIRMKRLGHVPDLELGAAIATLLGEPARRARE